VVKSGKNVGQNVFGDEVFTKKFPELEYGFSSKVAVAPSGRNQWSHKP
jgi:hypothetical protein